MKNITDESFKKYGRILNLDTTEFVETMLKKDSIPEGTAYVASDPDLEKLSLFKQLQTEVFAMVATIN